MSEMNYCSNCKYWYDDRVYEYGCPKCKGIVKITKIGELGELNICNDCGIVYRTVECPLCELKRTVESNSP